MYFYKLVYYLLNSALLVQEKAIVRLWYNVDDLPKAIHHPQPGQTMGIELRSQNSNPTFATIRPQNHSTEGLAKVTYTSCFISLFPSFKVEVIRNQGHVPVSCLHQTIQNKHYLLAKESKKTPNHTKIEQDKSTTSEIL